MHMNKSVIVAKVPKLRFPEFTKSDTVVFEKGDRLFDSISNKNHNSDLPILAITQEHGAIPRDQIDYNVSVTDKSLESYKVVEVGDFIISLRSFQGGIEYSQYRGICSPAYVILRKKKNIVEDYYKYYFKTDRFIQDLNKDIEGIRDGKMVSYNQFSALLLPNPEKKEQQEIADCLASIDSLIAEENKKLVALNTHKNGLMQKLFPAEGKNIPEWRFPEFRGKGDWKRTELGKLIEIKGRIGYRGYTTEDIVNQGEGAISLSPSNITEKGTLEFKNSTYISWSKYEESPEIMLNCGYTVLVKTGSSFGKAAYVSTLTEKATINPQIVVLKPMRINEFFLYLLICSSNIQKQITECVVGGAIPTLSQENISKFSLYIPKEEEQQKIAECFLAIDELISVQREIIGVLKMHKKGLLLGLFPANEEAAR